jgi:hypothetical protein
MPFSYGPYHFSKETVDQHQNHGFCVYGLSRSASQIGIAYVGRSTTLRDRLNYWLSNPPGYGLTHFFAEAFETEAQMIAREERLIKEFQPALNTLLK